MVQPALSSYITHLRDRVRKMELTLNSAANQQSRVMYALALHHEIDDIGRGLNLLYVDPKTKEGTKPPSDDAQSRMISLCESLFEGICDLILEPCSFPHRVKLPGYLARPDDTLWLFPTPISLASPRSWAERHSLQLRFRAFDFANGRVCTLKELEELEAESSSVDDASNAEKNDRRRRAMVTNACRQIAAANDDFQHHQRRQFAFHAVGTFCVLFLAQTGMNWAQVVELSWSNDFEISASHQAFRTIKWRAGGKIVSFELPAGAMGTFKRYLAIRKYLLNGHACDTLFLGRAMARGQPPPPLKGNLLSTFTMLRRIDPALTLVTSRQWRAAKSDWLVRNTDPSTAAIVLQNTERTVLASYAEGSESIHLKEMSAFLTEVSSKVLLVGEVIDGGIPRAVGVCASFGTPIAIAPVAVQPDCSSPEGCLFCEKFKIHADVKDTRKLLSCRYCLRQLLPLAGSEEQIKAHVEPIFRRIEALLDEVRKREPTMVDQVTREVDEEGELDPYWAQKYNMLVSLGVVA
jgi:integrase